MDLQAVVTTFGLLFLMEMGDKTQLAVLSLTARTRRPLAIFTGATLALMAVTLLGVVAGGLATRLVPGHWVARGAAVTFVVIGLLMVWSALRHESSEAAEGEIRDLPKGTRSILRLMAGTFGLLFVAEMGDKSQLAVIGLTAQTSSPVSVFVGAAVALALLTSLAVLVGQVVTKLVPVRVLSLAAGALFIIIGVLSLLGVF